MDENEYIEEHFLCPLKLWESVASCISEMKSAITLFTECVSNYSKLVNLFGKRHSVSEQLFKWLPKSPFSLATPQLHEDLDQNGNQIQTTPRIPFFGKGSFVTFDLAILEAIGNKRAVSDLVFKVTRIV